MYGGAGAYPLMLKLTYRGHVLCLLPQSHSTMKQKSQQLVDVVHQLRTRFLDDLKTKQTVKYVWLRSPTLAVARSKGG